MSPVLASAVAVVAASQEEFDPNDVTPGIVGFIATFFVMAAVLLLVLDMVRRIRRVNYRAEAQERIAAEAAEAEAADAAGSDAAGAGSAGADSDVDTDAPQPDAAASDSPPAERD